MSGPPKGINDRLMTMKLPLLNGKQNLIIVSSYAPIMTNSDDTKAMFYEELNSIIQDVPKEDKLIILGDFNARVGCDYQAWEGILGKYGVGQCNSNGLLLL